MPKFVRFRTAALALVAAVAVLTSGVGAASASRGADSSIARRGGKHVRVVRRRAARACKGTVRKRRGVWHASGKHAKHHAKRRKRVVRRGRVVRPNCPAARRVAKKPAAVKPSAAPNSSVSVTSTSSATANVMGSGQGASPAATPGSQRTSGSFEVTVHFAGEGSGSVETPRPSGATGSSGAPEPGKSGQPSAEEIAKKLEEVAHKLQEAASSSGSSSQLQEALSKGAKQLEEAAKQLQSALASGPSQLQAALEQAASQLQSALSSGPSQLQAALETLAHKLQEAASSSGSSSQLQEALSKGAKQLEEAAKELSSSTLQLSLSLPLNLLVSTTPTLSLPL